MRNSVSWMIGLSVCIALWPLDGAMGDYPPDGGPTPTDLHSVGEPVLISKVDNPLLSRLFLRYEADTKILVEFLSGMMIKGVSPSRWEEVRRLAVDLREQSSYLLKLGRRARNPTWEYYASNLYHHCLELEEVAQAGNGRESIFLAAILISHLGKIQSANPQWLKWYLNEQMSILFNGIENRDKETVRDAAEVMHESASKILLSASIVPEQYAHHNWQRNVHQINELGDTILGDVNRGDWEKAHDNATLIRHIYLRWANSFKESPHDH